MLGGMGEEEQGRDIVEIICVGTSNCRSLIPKSWLICYGVSVLLYLLSSRAKSKPEHLWPRQSDREVHGCVTSR